MVENCNNYTAQFVVAKRIERDVTLLLLSVNLLWGLESSACGFESWTGQCSEAGTVSVWEEGS